MKPHKHAELIKQWADGAEVEFYSEQSKQWIFTAFPHWGPEDKFRIKPEPDRIEKCSLHMNLGWRYGQPPEHLKHAHHYVEIGEFKLIFDGATGKLKSAEVL